MEVNERIKYFREHFKGWALTTEFVELTDDKCTIKAAILNEVGDLVANGCASETKGSTYINKTSFIENCETSAWGRALGNLGIGIDGSVASAEEVKNAVDQDKQKPKAKKVEEVKKLTDAQLVAMIVAVGEGKREKVVSALPNYIITKAQKQKIDNCLKLEKTNNNQKLK